MFKVTASSFSSLSRIQKVLCSFTFFVLIVVIPLYAFKVFTKDGYSDFDVYYRAVERWKAGQFDIIYNYHIDGATPFRYGPPFLFFMRPFGLLTFEWSRLAWYLSQVIFFSIGFYGLYRILQTWRRDAAFLVCFSLLYVMRFILDSFMIGQATALMFVGLVWSLKGWLEKKPAIAACFLAIPAVIKILPGALYALVFSFPKKFSWRVFSYAWLSLVVASAITLFGFGGPKQGIELTQKWFAVSLADSDYSDDAHYGTQSLKSALLRIADMGVMSRELALSCWRNLTIAGFILLFVFWILRRPKDERGILLFFSMGIFTYLWFMPETFKYSQPLLAFPVLALISGPLNRLSYIALIIGALVLSLAGLDIVGSDLFFWIQKKSLPFFASVLLGVAVIQQAVRHSVSRRHPEAQSS